MESPSENHPGQDIVKELLERELKALAATEAAAYMKQLEFTATILSGVGHVLLAIATVLAGYGVAKGWASGSLSLWISSSVLALLFVITRFYVSRIHTAIQDENRARSSSNSILKNLAFLDALPPQMSQGADRSA